MRALAVAFYSNDLVKKAWAGWAHSPGLEHVIVGVDPDIGGDGETSVGFSGTPDGHIASLYGPLHSGTPSTRL